MSIQDQWLKKETKNSIWSFSFSYVIFKDWSGQKIILKSVSNIYKNKRSISLFATLFLCENVKDNSRYYFLGAGSQTKLPSDFPADRHSRYYFCWIKLSHKFSCLIVVFSLKKVSLSNLR